MQGSKLHFVKHQGKLLASPSGTVIGFKHSKHAGMVKRYISQRHFDVRRISETHYNLRLLAKTHQLQLEVTSSALEYFSLICKLNNVPFVIVNDVVAPSQNFLQLTLDGTITNKSLYTDMRMIRGNLEKLFQGQ